MTAERWQLVKQILSGALDIEPSKRDQYLTKACEHDLALRAEVESLIDSYEHSADMLDAPALNSQAALDEVEDKTVGSRIGPYEIVEEIGHGGMGTVYRALRSDGEFIQEVAIKIVKCSVDDRSIVRRFRHERQILAALDHPNIARIIDGGTTRDARPYLVMEYIDGIPIDQYCDEHHLTAEDRLRLFLTVCPAVQCAHEHGIIHRDIKPTNILITGDGVPKLLDFGIAKILNRELSTQTIEATLTAHRLMTPEYASPEQVKGEPVAPTSDVYSLAVLLYQLLTGHRPYVLKTRAPHELAQAICEAEPEAPSTAVQRSEVITRGAEQKIEVTPESVSRARNSDPDKLRKCLKGDLDNIILMALRKDPARRYSSASQFADDIRRHLDGRPVMARPDTAIYRTTKFFHRHRSAITAALIAVAIVLVLSISAIGLLFRGGSPDRSAAAPVPFTTFAGDERQPAFSPDGTRIAFVWGGDNNENSDIFVKPIEGDNLLRVTHNPAEDVSPVWSPDGSRLAFLRASKQETAIFVAPLPAGIHGKVTDLYPDRADITGRQLAWSPDGKFLAVADKNGAQEPFSIFLVEAQNGRKQRLTIPPQQSIGDITPAFSPNGKLLAFIRAQGSGVSDVYVASFDGSPAKRITAENRGVLGLTFTPDGNAIMYSSNRTGSFNLWQVPVSGGKPRLVHGVGDGVSDPTFANTGPQLAYSQFSADTNIWRQEISPGTARAVGRPKRLIYSTQYDAGPSYSPDGKRIAFRSSRSGTSEIWVADDQGRSPLKLTNFGGPLTGTPRWMADGRRISFDSRPNAQAHIFTVDAQGGTPVQVTNEDSEQLVASSSVDGKWIYFSSNRNGSWQVWKIRPGTSEMVQVTRNGGFAPLESPDGRYVYYAKARTLPGLWRVPVGGGTEELVLETLKQGYWGYWAVTEAGIYYVDKPSDAENAGIYLYSFATKQTARVMQMDKPPKYGSSAFCVSPDRRFITYVQVDQSGSDIMLVDSSKSAP